MTTKETRAALYLRVSTTDGQTTENQRMALVRVAAYVAGRSSKPTRTLASRAQRGATNAQRSTRCSRTPSGAASNSHGLVHRQAGQERPARRQRDGGDGCCRSGALFRPAGHRQPQPVRQGHDADGLCIRQTGKGDDQSTCRGRPKPCPRTGNPEASDAHR